MIARNGEKGGNTELIYYRHCLRHCTRIRRPDWLFCFTRTASTGSCILCNFLYLLSKVYFTTLLLWLGLNTIIGKATFLNRHVLQFFRKTSLIFIVRLYSEDFKSHRDVVISPVNKFPTFHRLTLQCNVTFNSFRCGIMIP